MAAIRLNVERYMEVNKETDGEAFETLEVPWRGEGAEGKMGILYDGMCGEYVLAGKIIGVSSDEGDGFSLLEVEPISQELAFEVAGWITENDLAKFVDDENHAVKNILVTHWH